LKKEDMIRKEKERESPEDWDVSSFQKGPLIDMFGPGSVFYSIRMKAKQREMERLTFKARVDKRRVHCHLHITCGIKEIKQSNYKIELLNVLFQYFIKLV
jgi:hypothetical protein